MEVSQTAFWAVSAVAIVGALLAVTLSNIVRAALALALSFVAVAGIFVVLASPFLGVVQLIISAGAIPIVTIFIIMMTHSRLSLLRGALPALAAAVVGIPLLAVLLSQVLPRLGGPASITYIDTRTIGAVLLTEHLIAFLAMAVILDVALVGAIVLTREEVRRRAEERSGVARAPTRAEREELARSRNSEGAH
jgi:NADH-quinone oxidoreductase subunit J